MDNRKIQLKALKKLCRKAKRKTVTLWKTLGVITLVLALLLSIGAGVVKLFDNTMAAMLGGQFWTLVNEDPNAIYFEMDFMHGMIGRIAKNLCWIYTYITKAIWG